MKLRTGPALFLGLSLLVAIPPLASAATGDPVAEIRDAYKEAKRERSLTSDQAAAWIVDLFGLAEEGVGTDQGFEALDLILELGDRFPETKAARERVPAMMIAGYADDLDKMGELVDRVDLDVEQYDALWNRTTNDRVRATLLLADLRAATKDAGYVKISEDDVIRGMAACEQLNSVYAELLDRRGKPFREVAASACFQMQNLRIGMVAPDIVAPDIDGVEFKLSDYRGKVVVLDFWGNW